MAIRLPAPVGVPVSRDSGIPLRYILPILTILCSLAPKQPYTLRVKNQIIFGFKASFIKLDVIQQSVLFSAVYRSVGVLCSSLSKSEIFSLPPHSPTAQRYNIFSRYTNKILILIGNVLIFELIFVLFPALLLVHSLPNLKIYLFMSKKSCNFAPIFMVCET